MPRNLSRRALFGLRRVEPSGRLLDDFYARRSPSQGEPAGGGVRPELHGLVEATRVGQGDAGDAATAPEDIPLPELQDEEIDLERAAQLFLDIEHATELLDVRLKGGATVRASCGRPSLSAAYRALEQRSVAGVQLRYRYRGSEWWDTLMRTETGVRVVRIEQRRR